MIHCKTFVPCLSLYFACEKMFASPSNGKVLMFIHFCDVLPLNGGDADIRLVEVRRARLRLGAGKIVLL